MRKTFDAQLEFLERAGERLASRGAQVIEGHGDLRAEHVHLGPPVAVIDSLEFDRQLRLLDPAEEMALLALEIEQLGFPSTADALLGRFRVASSSPPGAGVLDFYASHRAVTRAKVAAWHLDDPQFPDAAPWIARSHAMLEAAMRYAARALYALDHESTNGRVPALTM